MSNIDLKWFAKTKGQIQNTAEDRISKKYKKAKQILQCCCGKDNNESVGKTLFLKYTIKDFMPPLKMRKKHN